MRGGQIRLDELDGGNAWGSSNRRSTLEINDIARPENSERSQERCRRRLRSSERDAGEEEECRHQSAADGCTIDAEMEVQHAPMICRTCWHRSCNVEPQVAPLTRHLLARRRQSTRRGDGSSTCRMVEDYDDARPGTLSADHGRRHQQAYWCGSSMGGMEGVWCVCECRRSLRETGRRPTRRATSRQERWKSRPRRTARETGCRRLGLERTWSAVVHQGLSASETAAGRCIEKMFARDAARRRPRSRSRCARPGSCDLAEDQETRTLVIAAQTTARPAGINEFIANRFPLEDDA